MASEQTSAQSKFPLSVKAVIVMLVIMLLMVIGIQAVSFVDFDLALPLGFQEDDPNSLDPFIRGRGKNLGTY